MNIFEDNYDEYQKHMPEIQRMLNYSDILRGQIINKRSISYLKSSEIDLAGRVYKDHYFSVISESFFDESYGVVIRTSNMGKLVKFSCDCYQFEKNSSCKHVVACLKNFSDVIFEEKYDVNNISKSILKKYSDDDQLEIKKEVFLDLEIEPHFYENYYYGSYYFFELKLKIGTSKMYNYKTHQTSFINVYEREEGECVFGKEFTFNPNTNFFSNKNKKILNYINRFIPNLNRCNEINSNSMCDLLDELFENDYEFKFDNHIISSLKTGFPFKTYIKELDNDKYELEISISELVPIGDRLQYVYTNGDIYKLDRKTSMFIEDMIKSKTNKLVIDKKDLNLFSKGILPIVKKQLEVDEKLKDKITIVDNPECELYFDISKDNVILNVKFIYDKTIDYFDKNEDILRDFPYENNIINEIISYGFNIEKNKLILDDIEKEVYLLEYGLNELSSKYKIYTTENFKKVNLKKKTNISSTFSIGKDNILSYDFNLDGIDNKEVVNILKNIKEKKKYYRLKSGEILDLDDENLNELNNLVDDMEFSDEEIINGRGEIQKYRAIYLDSIRNTKYHIVKTNNLFIEFVNNFYKYKNQDIKLSDKDKEVLRDYQITGVKWLYNLDKTGFGGILADEMGLGKTIQVIYYIKEILKEDKEAKFLIIVPTSLVYNWEHEFNTFANDIKIKLIVGNRIKRKQLQEENDDTNVFITSYGLVREDEEYYINNNYHAIILDEAQNIKNAFAGITRAVKNIKADVKFALTGTPIENSALELWSIFDFIMPGYLSSYQKFNSKYKISDDSEEANELIVGLSNQINPFILRRKKSDVVKELPAKIENNIYIDLSESQKKLYVTELEKVKKKMEETLNDEGMGKARFLILQLLTKLRQICIDPKIIYEDYDGGSNKIDRLLTIVDESIKNGHKILIFTSFRTALNIVKDKLEDNDIKSYVIDGSVDAKTRMERVESFNDKNSDVKVFLIMLKSGGTGLNLTEADVVIHLDLWWNPQAENQATDRAHRIGQKNVVEVIRLISKGTIEEKVLELQTKKKELSDKLIDGTRRDENILSSLTEEDIKNLLSYENKE